MLDLKIDLLALNIKDATGHEHRIQPIAARAATLFAARLEERWADDAGARGTGLMDSVMAPPISLNLNGISDEQAANEIASAWLEALVLKLKL